MFAVDHGIRSGALLGKMDYGLWREIFNDGGEKVVLSYITHKELNGISGQLFPGSETIGKRENWRQGLHTKLVVPLPPREIIGYRNGMTLPRQI
jgi:hypothetical protein